MKKKKKDERVKWSTWEATNGSKPCRAWAIKDGSGRKRRRRRSKCERAEGAVEEYRMGIGGCSFGQWTNGERWCYCCCHLKAKYARHHSFLLYFSEERESHKMLAVVGVVIYLKLYYLYYYPYLDKIFFIFQNTPYTWTQLKDNQVKLYF